jgi:hypothetical protein
MTLLVAGISDQTIWMVADTLITGPLGRRYDEHQIKVVPSADGKALIGFAGEQLRGTEAIEHARHMPAGTAALDYLIEVQRTYPVDFAYGHVDPSGPHLFRIVSGVAEGVRALQIGAEGAFEQFQSIRHRMEIEPVPHSISTFMMGTRSPDKPPETLNHAITAMLRLFSERAERDVGGAAIPYLLGPTGAYLCGYGYSVSDPITPDLRRGDLIPHGTSHGGGFGVSVTEFDNDRGIIVYWLQKPGGTVYLRTSSGYETISIDGSPSEFRRGAETSLGQPVEIWFGDSTPRGKPDSIAILSDENGKQAVAVARYGNELQLSAIDVSSNFRTKLASMDMSGQSDLSCSIAKAVVAEDSKSVTLRFSAPLGADNEIAVDSVQLDEMILALAAARARMVEPVPAEPLSGPLKREAVIIDPAWRTNFPPNPSLNGLMLRLRHPGYGWLTFLLPHHECISLADWLSNNASRN